MKPRYSPAERRRARIRLVAQMALIFASTMVSAKQTPIEILNTVDITKEPICRLAYHQSAVLDDKLYVTGGIVRYNNESYLNTKVPNTLLRVLDLSKSINLTSTLTDPFASHLLPSTVPSISSGVLWADPKTSTLRLIPGIGSYGVAHGSTLGLPTIKNYSEPTQDTTYIYTPSSQSWTSKTADLNPIGTDLTASFGKSQASIFVPQLNRGYLLGGALGKEDSHKVLERVFPGNLITFDATAGGFKNETTNYQLPRAGAGMVFIEGIGKSGALVVLGGIGDGWRAIDEKFTMVDVYDIATSTWYRQKTTGAVPPTRDSFCLVSTTAPDKSSYNIHLYGGGLRQAGYDPTIYHTTHVLSLPAFEWVLANDDAANNELATGGNDEMTCHLVGGGSQMLVIGGRGKAQFSDLTCKEGKAGGLALLDLNTMKWVGEYQPGLEEGSYRVPEIVWRMVGGNETGYATKMNPYGGFVEDGLEKMFNITEKEQELEGDPEDKGRKKSNVGAIVGGVIGGLLGVVVVGLAVFFCMRRKNDYERTGHREIEGAELDASSSTMADYRLGNQVDHSQLEAAHTGYRGPEYRAEMDHQMWKVQRGQYEEYYGHQELPGNYALGYEKQQTSQQVGELMAYADVVELSGDDSRR